MIPRITITKDNGDLDREVWIFWFDERVPGLVLDEYTLQTRSTKRHKWVILARYVRLRHDHRRYPEPNYEIIDSVHLPEPVRNQALEIFLSRFKVTTAEEIERNQLINQPQSEQGNQNV